MSRWQIENVKGLPVRPGDDPIVLRIDGDIHVLRDFDGLHLGEALTIASSRALSGAVTVESGDHLGHLGTDYLPPEETR